MAYKVLQVISGDTFQVKPEWRMWTAGKGGNLVKINGYQLPPRSDKAAFTGAKIKLFNFLTGKTVELKKPVGATKTTVTCDVYVDGKHLCEYFPEYQPTSELNSGNAE